LDSRRSTSRIVHKLGNASFYWSSKLQPTTSLLSIESKYQVLTNTAKDIVSFQRLFNELGMNSNKPTILLSDNQACIKLVDNLVMHAWTKHIEIQHHYICEITKSDQVQIQYVPTASQ